MREVLVNRPVRCGMSKEGGGIDDNDDIDNV